MWMVGGGGVGNSIFAAACVTANFPAAPKEQLARLLPLISLSLEVFVKKSNNKHKSKEKEGFAIRNACL